MSMTLLQLVQQASGEIGLSVPTTVIGNTNADVVQFLYLINGLGNDIARQHGWEAMNKAYIIQTAATSITGDTVVNTSNITNASSILGIDSTYQVSGNGINQATYVTGTPSGSTIPLTQPSTGTFTGSTFTMGKVKYPMPADFDRQIDKTHWDKTKHWEMMGPSSAQQWEWLLSGYISTGPRIRYRIFGGYFQIWPMVNANEVLGFEYVSTSWVSLTGAGDTNPTKSAFTVDTDTCIFADRLIVDGLKLAYFSIKGFDTTAMIRSYEMQLNIAKASDAGSATLSMAPTVTEVLINWTQVPDSGYGS